MKYELKNAELCVTIDSYGAELHSMKDANGKEYMWCGDGKFWARHSPVLFPIVGKIKDNTYRYEGATYSMGQHGFARDMEFELTSQNESEIWFKLSDDEETMKKYPFRFVLEIGYRLKDKNVDVLWKVTNPDNEKTLHFSIGAHPAFVCPWEENATKDGYSLRFDNKKTLLYRFLNQEKGLLAPEYMELTTNDGICPITDEFFDTSAYVFEDSQLSQVDILDKNGTPYVGVAFSAPLVGIWSPEKKNAPFLCIEPWYGRCDMVDFDGDFSEREHAQALAPQENFEASYRITIY